MIITLIIIIVILLIVIYYLYTQNQALRNNITEEKEENKLEKEVGIEVREEIEEEKIDSESIEPTYVFKDKTTSKKKEVINTVNETLGRDELSKVNTNFSKLNKGKPGWSFDILPDKFLEDLHLILFKEKGFIWITVPKGVVNDVNAVFRIRDDNGRAQLEISAERGLHYLRDIASAGNGLNFEQYIAMEFY